MLTKDDKKFISELLDKRFKKNNEILVKNMLDLFTVTNERIDKLNKKLSDRIDSVNKNLSEKIDDTDERIDKVFNHLRDDFGSIEDHERRIEKVEEKVFPISA